MLEEHTLVVRRQPHKGRRPDYGVFDPDGQPVGRAVYLSSEELKLLMRRYGLRHWTAAALRIVDTGGAMLFVVAFPGWRGRAVLLISDGEGNELGDAVKTKGRLKVSYELRHAKRRIGSIQVMDRRQRRTLVRDDSGAEVAELRTVTEEAGPVADRGDAYEVQIHKPLHEPLRSVVVACAVAFQAAIGSEAAVGETDVVRMSLIPRALDSLRRR
jgi:hypothetical protein